MAIETLYPAIRPSLNLDFANAKALDPRITFSRASAATYYDGKTVAKAEENLFVNSQSFGISTWVLAFASIVGNSISAPDGTLTATKLLADNSQNYHAIRQGNSLPVGNVYTMSVYAKAAEFSRLYLSDLANGRVAASFDLVALSSTNPANSPGYLSSSVSDVGGGWRRCVVTFSAGSSTISLAFAGYPDTGATLGLYGANYTGDGTSGIYIWGAQLEARSSATAYTPTTTQPITNYMPVLLTAPAGVPRFDHNPVTGESLGLLIEETRTNLLLRSQDFITANWLGTGSDVAVSCIAPDASLSGHKLSEDLTSGVHYRYQGLANVSGTTTYTLSAYVKAAGRSRVQLWSASGSPRFSARFDLASKTATGLSNVGGAVLLASTIEAVGNDWFRVSITGTTGADNILGLHLFLDNGSNHSYQGDGYSGIYIWGAQIEVGTFPTSYIKTEASQATRAADSASMIGSNFSSWYRQDEGTLFLESINEGGVAGGNFGMSDGTNSNRLWVQNDTRTSVTQAYVMKENILQSSLALPGVVDITSSKVAMAYKANDLAATRSGFASVTDNIASIPVVNKALLNAIGQETAATSSGWIRRATYYPKRLTDAQLQALTA